jgi:CPA2 family monovalent cation:H+ antiporter-2
MNEIANHNHVWHVLGDVLLILALSGLIIPILQRIKVSPALGYLLCGLLIGPHALGLLAADISILSYFVVTDTELILKLAELGVVFLLFMIGLELSFGTLWELRKKVLGLGSAQILITALVIFLISIQFDNTLPVAILISMAFALSSTAVIMQLLTERHLISRPVGRICFSVLLMQDLAVVPILVLVSAFAVQSGGSVLGLLLEAFITAFIVVALIFAAGKLLLRPLLRLISPSQNAEWLFAVVLFLVIGAALLTQSFGLSAALGGFLAGLLIAETEFRHEVEVIIEPVKGLLMGIFFMSVGMATNLATILDYPLLLPASVIGIFLIKAIVFFPLALLFGISKKRAAMSAILLAQCGEFAFLVIGLAFTNALIPEHSAQFFLLVASVSLLITPFTTYFAPHIAMLFDDKKEKAESDQPLNSSAKDHIIIAGFGRVGRMLATILEDQKMEYVAIDKDASHIAGFHNEGYPVYFGNARHKELWQRLGIERARAAIITIDDYSVTKRIISALRTSFPLIPIIVRVKDTNKLGSYYDLGATAVVPETLESTLQLAQTMLEQTNLKEKEVLQIIDKHRKEILAGEIE